MNSDSNFSPVEQTGIQRRVHAQPQVAIKNDFVVQIPGALVDVAIVNKLTAAEWSLWLYLQRINPFADFTKDNEPIYRDIPSPSKLAVILGRDRKTIERAGQRLNELGLYRIRPKSWEGFNATAHESKRLLAELRTKKSHTEVLNSSDGNSESYYPPKKPPTEAIFGNNKNSGGYLTPSGVKMSQNGQNNPKWGKNVQSGVKKSQDGQNNPKGESESSHSKTSGAPQTLQTFQSYSESTDNIAVADEKFSGEEEEKEVSQGADDSEIPTEPLEPTGVLEEPQPDPIAQVEQATVQLLDEREIFDELRRLGIETNETVRATMRKHKANVSDAIAHVRQRYNNNERFMNITGAFVKACQEGAKPRSTTRTQVNPPSIEQMCQLEQAKVTGTIRDFYLAPSGSDREVVMVDTGTSMMPWWEFLV